MKGIQEKYSSLRLKKSQHDFLIEEVDGKDDVYIGVNRGGKPALFIRTGERKEETEETQFVALYVGTEFSLTFQNGKVKKGFFHSLQCTSPHAEDWEPFQLLIGALLTSEGGIPALGRLREFLHSLRRLFQVQKIEDFHAERVGLWGELFVMRATAGYAFWIPYWHSEPGRRFDFSRNGTRLEIKTTTRTERVHRFSHAQLWTRDAVVVASLMVTNDDAGLSLRSLLDECRTALSSPGELVKLEAEVRRVGMDEGGEEGPKFNSAEALKSLRWFRAARIPHWSQDEPAAVSNTQYDSDLSNVPPMGEREVEQWVGEWTR